MRYPKLAYLFPLLVILLAAAALLSLKAMPLLQVPSSPTPSAPQHEPSPSQAHTLTPTLSRTGTTPPTPLLAAALPPMVSPAEVFLSHSPSPTPPEEHIIRNIGGHKQYFPLGAGTALRVWRLFRAGRRPAQPVWHPG